MTFEETSWVDPIHKEETYSVFEDKYPVSTGHLLFVPHTLAIKDLTDCYAAAYRWGVEWVLLNACDSFNIGQNCGPEAGQTVEWPHIHLIARYDGDVKDPVGGVRNIIPGKGNYKK